MRYTEISYGYAFMVGDQPGLHRVAESSQKGSLLEDMIVNHLFHGKRHLVSHTQRGVSHTLQRIDVLIKTPELQISTKTPWMLVSLQDMTRGSIDSPRIDEPISRSV